MDALRIIVAKADVLMCAALALPWGQIIASVVLAAVLIWVVKAYDIERRNF